MPRAHNPVFGRFDDLVRAYDEIFAKAARVANDLETVWRERREVKRQLLAEYLRLQKTRSIYRKQRKRERKIMKKRGLI